MNWYLTKGNDADVVVSTRVRLARDVEGYSFPGRLSMEEKRQVRDQIEAALAPAGLLKLHMDAIPQMDRRALQEKHLISEELAKGETGKSVCISKDESISVMINEEDHIRVQALTAGFDPEAVYKKAADVSILLEQELPVAYSQKYGFLTACPTNTGTGLRASVMAHLPALTMTGKINVVREGLTKSGFAVRGYQGEHSKAVGNIYQISNQVTMGISEEEILGGFSRTVKHILQLERDLRKKLYRETPDKMEDVIYRSFGELKYARRMSEKEAMQHISDIRLGIALRFFKEVDEELAARLTMEIGTAALSKAKGKELELKEEEIFRAEKIRERLNEKSGTASHQENEFF